MLNWLRRLILYGVKQEESIDQIYDDLDDKLDRFEDLVNKTEPKDILLKAEAQDISDFDIKGNVSDFEKGRPLFCAACGKELMYSNRYNYDAKTGQKFIIRVDADCPKEGANYAYPTIAEHAHFYWDGKMWKRNVKVPTFTSSYTSLTAYPNFGTTSYSTSRF